MPKGVNGSLHVAYGVVCFIVDGVIHEVCARLCVSETVLCRAMFVGHVWYHHGMIILFCDWSARCGSTQYVLGKGHVTDNIIECALNRTGQRL